MILPSRIVAIWLAFAAMSVTASEKLNVLFIAIDDLRPEIAGFGASHMKTPHLDRLAASGIRFDRAYCMVPTCGASRAALMSGLRPASDRFRSYMTRASEDTPGITTLNTHFKNHGYTTLSLGKIFHHVDDNAEGWSETPWRPKGASYATEAALASRVKDRKGRLRGPAWENGGKVPDSTFSDGQIAEEAVDRLKSLAESESPFFLAVGFVKPHLPFVAPGRYYDLYPEGSITMPENYFPPKGAPEGAVHSSGELRSYSDIPKKGIIPEEKALELIRGYYAATSYTDAQVGVVLDALDRLGLKDSTLIVLWGDHGWNLGEHTMWCKHSCFETSVRSPLIFSGPEALPITPGTATDSLTEFIDIYPTLCDLTGLPKPDHLQGSSLIPVLKDPDSTDRSFAVSRFGDGDTIRTDQFRYTVYRNKDGRVSGHMLYDHQADPGENENLAEDPERAEIVRQLRKQLEANMGRPGDFH